MIGFVKVPRLRRDFFSKERRCAPNASGGDILGSMMMPGLRHG